MRVQRSFSAVQKRHLAFTPAKPAGGPSNRLFNIIVLGRILDTFVKRHGNRRGQIGLDMHTLLRPHKYFSSVDVGSEGDALFLNIPLRGLGKHLKAAAVC